MKISIVIPALNEEEGIGETINQIPVKKLQEAGHETEIVVADNGSTDRTAEIAAAHNAKVVFQPLRGYGNTYKAGFAGATGDIIITGDADMTYPFDAIPQLLNFFLNNELDFLSTDRLSHLNRKSMTWSHIIGNWVLSFMMKSLFHCPFRDSQSGMWIFKKDIWPILSVTSDGMAFSQEIKIEAFMKGFKCQEIPIEFRPRVGNVKLSTISDGIRNTAQLLHKRFSTVESDSILDLKNKS